MVSMRYWRRTGFSSELVGRGKENRTRTAGTAASEGLGHLTGVAANSLVTSSLTFYLKGGTFT